MLKAKKKNRVLRIPDEKLSEYKAMGYTITDEAGNVIYTPLDTAKHIAELETENAALRAKLEALEGNSTSQEENDDSGDESAVATDANTTNRSGRTKKT